MSAQRPTTATLEEQDAEWRDPANWHGGPLGLYYSKRDPRPFVPKRIPAMGVTINFANPGGVTFLVTLILVMGVVAYVVQRPR